METQVKNINGFNTEAIAGTVEAIVNNPKIADFELRAENKWITGGHNRSTIQGFYGACKEDSSRTEPFIYDNDEPPLLLGNNLGANPAEVVLHGLLGCMTTTMVLLAAARGIEVTGVTSRVEGDIDLQGFLGLSAEVEKGFSQVRVVFDIEGASEEQKQELLVLAQQSPMFNTLIQPADIQVSLHS